MRTQLGLFTRFFGWCGLAVAVLLSGMSLAGIGPAWADQLPLAPNLVDFESSQGSDIFLEAASRQAYWPLAAQFVTQKNQAFCGVASLVMVLNGLGVPAPTTPDYAPYTIFTQDNVFNDKTDKIITADAVAHGGMTLDQLGAFAASYGVAVTVTHASDSNEAQFRAAASDYLAAKGHFVLINYLRSALGQQTGGHISPLAAYDAKTDRFLILDVARYKYPPVWVTTKDLFAAMNTTDQSNNNRMRGYVLITAPPR